MKVLQLGLGPESTALYYMSSMGQLPRLDYAIFPDPGSEKLETLDYLAHLERWAQDNGGIEIVRVRGDWYEEISFAGSRPTIPAYITDEDGNVRMLRRECTYYFKTLAVNKAIEKRWSDIEKFTEERLYGSRTEVWKGVAYDQRDRLTQPSETWKVHVYPFADYAADNVAGSRIDSPWKMKLNDILAWYQTHGLPLPPRPCCTFCPYQPDSSWQQLKRKPEMWQQVVELDQKFNRRYKAYLHDSLKPLEEVEFTDNTEWKLECSGNCHL